MADTASVVQYQVAELSLGPAPADPWAELDVRFTAPDGTERVVPAFIHSSQWKVRYASDAIGDHEWMADGAEGHLRVVERMETPSRLSHGPLRVAADDRHLEHADGTPFLWLADTWWFGFVTNKSTDQEFADFAAQRAAQGFSVIQIVAGLPCEVEPFAAAGASRTGWAWEDGFTAPNLAWWDDADIRVQALLDNDLVPCLLGSWGVHFTMMDTRQLTRHWREMLARWGAYPVVWCISGEPQIVPRDESLPLLREPLQRAAEAGAEFSFEQLMEHLAPSIEKQLQHFNHLAGVIRDLEPHGRLITTHTVPGQQPWAFLDEPDAVDFWFLQTGHLGFNGLQPSIDAVLEAIAHQPTKPVINGEVNYEGIAGTSLQDIQRFLFWSHMLSGTAGHSYGAHGVWAFNTAEFPGQYSGLAPCWKDAAQLPGAAQVGLGAKLLRSYPWHQLIPDPSIVTPHQTPDARFKPYAARLPDGRRLIYFPSMAMNGDIGPRRLHRLGNHPWTARCFDLTTGSVYADATIEPDETGSGTMAFPYGDPLWPLPSWGDWLVELTPTAPAVR